MFERFTEKAIKVIMLAQEEARRLGHNFVGTEQILLGLIGEGTGVAAKVLKSVSLILRSISSTSGSTATVAADVCTLPWVSVSGTLWTLCTPLSYFNVE